MSTGADGQRQIEITVRDKMRESIESGKLDRTVRNTYGLDRASGEGIIARKSIDPWFDRKSAETDVEK